MRIIDIIKNIEFPKIDLIQYFKSRHELSPKLTIKIDKEYTVTLRLMAFMDHGIRNKLGDFNKIFVELSLYDGYFICNETKTIGAYIDMYELNHFQIFDINQIKEQDEMLSILQYGKILQKQVEIIL